MGRLDDRSPVPWWTVFGAPLLGVPVLAALLAVGPTHEVTIDPGESTGAVTVPERVEEVPSAGGAMALGLRGSTPVGC